MCWVYFERSDLIWPFLKLTSIVTANGVELFALVGV